MSSSLLLQQCPACLVRLTWIVFVMGGRRPYSWCLVGCCRQDLFNIARNIFFKLIIIIIIIIMSCRQHGYPRPSLSTSPNRSSRLADLQSYIPYPHIAAVCMFELVVLLLLSHMWGSIGVHHL